MIIHVVLLQPKVETTEEDITTALSHIQELQQVIPSIIEVHTGKNLSGYNQGYSHGFVMQFVDEECLKTYASHPSHQVVSNELQNISQRIIDFDITT